MNSSDTEYDPLTLVSELFPRLIRVVMAEISPAVQKSLQLNQSQIKVLMILDRYSSCTMSTLGIKAGLERGSMTSVVTALAERDLVERRQSNRDRRSVIVTLTDSGRGTASAALKELQRGFSQRLSHLSPEDQRTFCESLTALHAVTEQLEKNINGTT